MSSFLVAGCRTPIGKLCGTLSSWTAPQLGAAVVRDVLRRAGLAPEQVDEVVMGDVLQAGLGQAPARQAALGAGLPPTVSALTVNMMCGSGLRAVMLADAAIRAGTARCIVAGGMESMTRAPHLLLGTRSGWKYGHQQAVDSMIADGLWCAFENQAMGAAADHTAAKYDVSRADQDRWACESHRRAIAARDAGEFRREIVPIDVAAGKTKTTIIDDEGPRADADPDRLATLKPAFAADGTVTAGNASQISDGAAAAAVVDEGMLKTLDVPWAFRIVASATSGVAPREIFIAPVAAVERCLAAAGWSVADVDLFEINEAFASQTSACARGLKVDEAQLNVRGGAIALGHPIGASGARVLVTLMHALVDRNLRRGAAALCLGGGNAVALLIERM